ncbi:hypothetical protein FQZ97_926160 [compost metagenome]
MVGGSASSERRGNSVGSVPKPSRASTGPAPRPTARAWRSAWVVAILASTAASAVTQPSASAAARAVAKLQPVPWLFGVFTRGRLSQPRAWGDCSQSLARVSLASPPVMQTVPGPSACRRAASAGVSVALSSASPLAPPGPSRAAASRRLGVITVARGSSSVR